MNNVQVRNPALSIGSQTILSLCIKLSGLSWLGHMLSIANTWHIFYSSPWSERNDVEINGWCDNEGLGNVQLAWIKRMPCVSWFRFQKIPQAVA